MKFNCDIKFTDNTPQLHEALDDWVARVLNSWGMKITTYAKKLAQGHVDTSRLINSITYEVDPESQTVTVGTDAKSDSGEWPNGYVATPSPYPIYLELGTGIYAEKQDGRKEPWYWYDMKTKQWHFTRGIRPQPFLRPAVENHIDELRQIVVDEANNPPET